MVSSGRHSPSIFAAAELEVRPLDRVLDWAYVEMKRIQ
jgi:hypothetical protein